MSRNDDSYTRVDRGTSDQDADLPHSTDRNETDPDSGLPDPADRGEAAHREGE